MSRQKEIPEIILAATERGVHRLVRFAHSCCFGVTSLLALFLEPFVHYTVIFQKKSDDALCILCSFDILQRSKNSMSDPPPKP